MTDTTPETEQDRSGEDANTQSEMTEEIGSPDAAEKAEIPTRAFRVTPIRVAIAVAALAAAWQSAGLAKSLLSEPHVVFEKHASIENLDEAVAKAGVEDLLVHLTKGDGSIDIIYAGAPGCPHCQDFVSGEFTHYPKDAPLAPTSLSETIAIAEEKGLDLAYMPLALNGIDAVIASGEACAPPSDISAARRTTIAYGMVSPLESAAEKANAMMKERVDPEEIRLVLKEALESMNEKFSPGTEFDSACYEAQMQDYSDAVSEFYEVFGRHGTPSFYFREETGQVSRFSGSGGVAAMLRQVDE